MPRRRARLNLMHFCYLHLIVLGASIECKSVTTNTCCEIINVFSAGALAQFHPEHLGSYKLLKGEDHVYKAVTETQSFLFLFRSGDARRRDLVFDTRDVKILYFHFRRDIRQVGDWQGLQEPVVCGHLASAGINEKQNSIFPPKLFVQMAVWRRRRTS